MRLESGKYYRDREGDRAYVLCISKSNKAYGLIFVDEKGKDEILLCLWHIDGFICGAREKKENPGDLVSEWPIQPVTTWAIQSGSQPPVFITDEQVAKSWALKHGGRAFQMVEVME